MLSPGPGCRLVVVRHARPHARTHARTAPTRPNPHAPASSLVRSKTAPTQLLCSLLLLVAFKSLFVELELLWRALECFWCALGLLLKANAMFEVLWWAFCCVRWRLPRFSVFFCSSGPGKAKNARLER